MPVGAVEFNREIGARRQTIHDALRDPLPIDARDMQRLIPPGGMKPSCVVQ